MKVESVSIESIHTDPANVRTHPERNLATIKASLARFGQQKPIVVDGDGIVRAGNGTLEAARALGWAKIDVVRTPLKGSEATAYAIADNRSAELAEWDGTGLAEQLRSLQSEDFDLDAVGYTDDEIGALIDGLAAELTQERESEEAPEAQVDRADELLAKWAVKPGDVWAIPSLTTPGKEHRLLCGDSTKAEDMDRVMGGEVGHLVVTDPPYGVDYEGGATKRDRLVGDETTGLYLPILELANKLTDKEAAVYLWHSDSKSAAVSAAVSAAGYELRCTIVWNKNIAQFGAFGAQYKTKHEPCYYLYKKSSPPRWFGPTNEVTVWDVARNQRNELHPTEKPVEVMARPIRNSSSLGQVVIDFFSGSGTTMVAAEQLGRLCRAVEIAPKYVAVALERLSEMGLSPYLQAGG